MNKTFERGSRKSATARPQSRAPSRPQAGGRSKAAAGAAAGATGEAGVRGISPALLKHTAQALGAVLEFDFPADAVLSRYFREQRMLGHRDRGFIAETVYAILRRLRWLHRLCEQDSRPFKLLIAWLARGEGWTVSDFDGLLTASERDWLLELKQRKLEPGSLAEQCDLPDWLFELLAANYGEAGALELAQGLNRPAPLDLRVNLLKSDRERLLTTFKGQGIVASPGPWSPQAIRLADKPALQQHPLFKEGCFEVQDAGSQLLGLLVQPRRGEMVVDFCAGAGGKTLQLGAMMRSTGRLYALDVAEKRLAKLKPRMARAGLSNVHPMLIAHEQDARLKRMAGKADRVLVDAPCTGLGTLRRNPDLKWRQSPAAVAEMNERQRAILASAARLVRPGGRLVYATCSLLAEENDQVVDDFLASHEGFQLVSAQEVLAAQGVELDTGERLRLYPHRHDTDGFFAVVMERKAERTGESG